MPESAMHRPARPRTQDRRSPAKYRRRLRPEAGFAKHFLHEAVRRDATAASAAEREPSLDEPCLEEPNTLAAMEVLLAFARLARQRIGRTFPTPADWSATTACV